jgi:hypothetical protein
MSETLISVGNQTKKLFQILLQEGSESVLELYFQSREQGEKWTQVLEDAASAHPIENYYRFSSDTDGAEVVRAEGLNH